MPNSAQAMSPITRSRSCLPVLESSPSSIVQCGPGTGRRGRTRANAPAARLCPRSRRGGAHRVGSSRTRAGARDDTPRVRPHRPAEAARIGRSVGSLEELLEQSDIVSLHVPLTAETQKLIGRRELSLMREGAILVNTSRGQLIDEPALIESLETGHLAAAGLDVYATEPIEPDNRLLGLENAVLSPHSAAFTEEALKEVRLRAVEEALRAVSGKPPLDPVPA